LVGRTGKFNMAVFYFNRNILSIACFSSPLGPFTVTIPSLPTVTVTPPGTVTVFYLYET